MKIKWIKKRALFTAAVLLAAVLCITSLAHENTSDKIKKTENAEMPETYETTPTDAERMFETEDAPYAESLPNAENAIDAAERDITAVGFERVLADAAAELSDEIETADNLTAKAAAKTDAYEETSTAAETKEPDKIEESTKTEETPDDDIKNEYADLAIANVDNYVNVRSEPNTDSEIVGKMYDGSVAQVLSVTGDWLQMVSGDVKGYIKAEYFIYGDDAAAVAHNYVTQYAVVKADRLNVRKEPDISAQRIGYIDNGERVKLIEWGSEWSKVKYTDSHEGYVASEYITIAEEFIYAKSIEEERAELAAIAALQARMQTSEEAVPERKVISVPPPQTNYETVSELRMAIVDYAKQFLGNRYVMGGRSLESGTDCSGFTCYIYAAFGYSISRTPQGQLTSAGRGIDMSQIQPGDIICFSSNGKTCTHVAMYIGDGKIIHSANSRAGVIIGDYKFSGTILGVRSVVD